jgi:hypothetical protein
MKELPDINTLPVHSITLPVQGITHKFVPYTIEQERNILMALESKDIPAIIDNYKKLIGECFQESVDFETLTAMEFIMIAVSLRGKSKGEVLEITTKCKKCEKPIELDVAIEDHIITENEKVMSKVVKIDDDLAFEIYPARMDFLYRMPEIKTQQDILLETAVHSIKKIIWKEEIFDKVTPDMIKQKVKLTYPILKKIFAAFNELIKIKMVIQVECVDKKDCGHKEDYVIRDFLKYLT